MKKKPSRLSEVLSKIDLHEMSVLDLGCFRGEYLSYFGKGSCGLDIDIEAVNYCKENGLEARVCNLESDEWPVHKNSFDAAWVSNYFEHALSPHKFLITLRRYLKHNGLVIFVIPISHPILASIPIRRNPFRGYKAADHVSFFSKSTAIETIERAGFVVKQIFTTRSIPHFNFYLIRQVLSMISFNLIFVAQKIDSWNYDEKAHKVIIDGKIQFK